MTQMVLKNEILDTIKNDGVLYGKVANALNIKPVSLTYLLNNNSTKLTQISVMNVLRNHFKAKDSELLEPELVA